MQAEAENITASRVRGKQPAGGPRSSVWTFKTCKRKALQVLTQLKSNKKNITLA